MIIEKNVLSNQVFESLQKSLFHPITMNWCCDTTAYPNNVDPKREKYDYSFFHMAYNNDRIMSDRGQLLSFCVLTALDKIGVKLNKLYRIRVGLIMISPIHYIHEPHVDLPHKHKTGLIYINDSDGDTILYKEKYDPVSNIDPYNFYKNVLKENVTVDKEITPEANKLICFDGFTYHSSTAPMNNARRMAINFNFE